jgi:hypothetical protein
MSGGDTPTPHERRSTPGADDGEPADDDASPAPPPLTARLGSPAVRRIAAVASALGPSLCARVVFIGAAVLPLLEADADMLGSPRPTRDVDGVVATTTYTEKALLEEELRARRFRHVHAPPTHLDRWQAPDGTILDLVACGAHPGGTGAAHDRWVIEHAVTVELPPRVRHASAVGLLLLKCGAYRDRGRASPLASKDLADIVALMATRRAIVAEVAAAPTPIRSDIARTIAAILADVRARSALATHVDDREPLVPDLLALVDARLHALAAVGHSDR